MGEERVADLTLSQLKGLIAQVVDERLPNGQQPEKPVDKEALQRLMDSVDSHRWTAAPGEPTLSEMIIEERELWRQGM